MSMFNWNAFVDSFPKVTILTWCILGALDQMCKVPFSTHRQSVFSQSCPPQKGKEKKKKKTLASIGLKGSTAKPSKTLSVHQLKEKKTAFRKVCLKSVKVMVFWVWCQETLSKWRTSACSHKMLATCADPANTHFLWFGVKRYGHQHHTRVRSFRCSTGL